MRLQELYHQFSADPMGFINFYFWDILIGVIAMILIHCFIHPDVDNSGNSKKNWIGVFITSVAYSIFFFIRHHSVIDITEVFSSNIEIPWLIVILVLIFATVTVVYSKHLWSRDWPTNSVKIQSLISFSLVMTSITITLLGFYWALLLVVPSYFVSCVYIVPIRRRWVITIFKKPFFADWACVHKQKNIHLDEDLDHDDDSLFLDNGNNIILLASWLPGFDLIPLDYVRIEKRFQTEQLPTNDPEDKDTAGGTLSIDYKIWFKINYWPKHFLKLDDDDRSSLDGVIKRIIEGVLADRISKINGLNTAMTIEASDKDDIILYDDSRVLQSIISNAVLINLKNIVFEHTGALLTEITIMDRNPDPVVEAEQNRLTATRTQIEEAVLQERLQEALGKAEGAKVVASINAIQGGVGIDRDHAVSLFTILKTMESDNKIILPAGLIDKLGSVLSN